MSGEAMKQITILNALNKRRVITSKMRKNINLISKYVSTSKQPKLFFKTEEDQREKVHSLVQSNEDLFKEVMLLTRRIEKTNLVTSVETEDFEKLKLSDLTFYKRQSRKKTRSKNPHKTEGFVNLLLLTYQSDVPKIEEKTIGSRTVSHSGEEGEDTRNNKVEKLLDFLSWVDAELDDINDSTNLVT